jgi:AcrR family transcriptional regulator
LRVVECGRYYDEPDQWNSTAETGDSFDALPDAETSVPIERKTERFSELATIHKPKTDRYHVAMTEADTRVAECAAELFHEHGITATGVEALSKAAGISKRTLYERFGSKDGLITAAFAAWDEPVFERFTGPAERAATPRAQIEQLFAELETAVDSPDFRGCPFTNASSELADPAHPAHEVIRRHKDRFRRWLLRRAREAGAADPAGLARQLMIVHAGVQDQALIQRSAKPARDGRLLVSALLDSALD